MGIFTKLSTLIRSNINDLISRAENPEKMLNQIILDMRDQLARAKREVAAAIADERKLKQQLDDEVKQTRDWEQRAMLAVRENRDDLAKQALIRQQEHAERAASLEQTWVQQSAEIDKLKNSLRQLNDKIDEAKRKRNLLIAKQKRAQAQRRIHETMSGLSDTSAFDTFNRMAEKIEDSERRLLAEAEVDQALAVPTMETEFLKLEAGAGSVAVEDRLVALKQNMGLLPPAAKPKQPAQLKAGKGAPPVQDGEFEEEAETTAEAPGKPAGRSDADLLREFERLEKASEG
jgi:phage shock protein A